MNASRGSRSSLRRFGASALALALGAITTNVAWVYVPVLLIMVVVGLPVTRGRALPRPAALLTEWLVRLERRRLAAFLDVDATAPRADRRGVAYLIARIPLGLLGGAILALLAYGAVLALDLFVGWVTGQATVFTDRPAGETTIFYLLTAIPYGIVLLFIGITGAIGVTTLERRLAEILLGPSPSERLQHRVSELSTSRSNVVDAVNDERRRIERDIHDGVQQRLVSLGLLLGRARRSQDADDGDKTSELLRQAHAEAQVALSDLQAVSWRIYPSVLDDLGLADALDGIAQRSSVPVRIRYEPADRLPVQVETAAYFLVAEGITNAVKHSGADLIDVEVTSEGTMIVVRITDNGRGGADPRGSGLSGLARRANALDGVLTVDSPAGGPTTLRAELPCG